MQILKFIILISDLPIFVSTVYGVMVFKQLGKELKAFFYFLFLSGIISLVSLIFWLNGMNNLPLLHIYVAGGFYFLAVFYMLVLRRFINGKIIWSIIILFLVFTLINSLFVQTIFTFNSYALTLESVFIIILSLSTYIVLLDDIVRDSLRGLSKSLNWINSGLFIYYTSSLLIFYFGNTITHSLSKEVSRYTWVLHSFFSVIMYSCFFFGLWHRPKS